MTSVVNYCILSGFAARVSCLSMAKDDDKPIFMRPGHNAGDLLETGKWQVLKEEKGLIEIEAHLPAQVLNPRQQLFGGFTGTYVDIVALYTVRTLFPPGEYQWAATVNMRIDYLAPVEGPGLRLLGELISDSRSTCLVATTFFDGEGNKLVYAITTLRKNPPASK